MAEKAAEKAAEKTAEKAKWAEKMAEKAAEKAAEKMAEKAKWAEKMAEKAAEKTAEKAKWAEKMAEKAAERAAEKAKEEKNKRDDEDEAAGFAVYEDDSAADEASCLALAASVSEDCGNGEGAYVKATWGATGASAVARGRASRKFPLTSSSRVAIIGGGPAGLHMASLLKKRGVEDVTIFEKTDRVGGKSYTVWRDGIPHEMGTCYLHNMYGTIRDLLVEYGIEKAGGWGVEGSAEVVPEGDRSVFSKRIFKGFGLPGDWGQAHFNLTSFLGAFAIYDFASKTGVKLDAASAKKVIGAAVLKYVQVHNELVGDLKRGVFPEMPTSAKAKAAIDGKSFGEFLTDNGMSALIGYLELADSAQGYGLLFEVPALYGLWWIHPEILLNTITAQPKPSLTMLKKGYHQLWQAVADKHNLNVVFNADVTSIERERAGKHPVRVEHSVNGGESQSADFDFLVLAAPHRYAENYVEDLEEEEKEIFAAAHSYTLTTTLYESSPVPGFTDAKTKSTIAYSDDNLNIEGEGHWNCDRYSKPAVQGVASGDWEGTQTRVAYQFKINDVHEGADQRPPFKQNEELATILHADIAAAGVTDAKFIAQFPWSYFYHFGHEDLQKGFPWKLLGMQGNKNTWYIGSSACFESVHDVTTYNHLVLDRYD
jgi:hypothetical protein